MKEFYPLIFLVFMSFTASFCQTDLSEFMPLEADVPYGIDPVTPKLDELLALNAINHNVLSYREIDKGKGRYLKVYYLNGELYSGWTQQIYEENNHKYRFIQYKNGYQVWQIGYYENLVLDHDFHMFNGENRGSQRMWREDGSYYIREYYLMGGIEHGSQMRWYDKGVIARDALFDNGKCVYEKKYSKDGQLIKDHE